MKRFTKQTDLKVAIWLYLSLILIFWPLKALVNFSYGTYLEKSGKMPNIVYTKEQVTLNGVKPDDYFKDGIISTDNDPQIIINFDNPLYISNIQVEIQYSLLPGEIASYYAIGEKGFSERRRIMGEYRNGKVICFEYGVVKCDSIRIDPTMFAGNAMSIKNITLNTHRNFSEYFKISFSQFFRFLIKSTMVVALVLILKQGLEARYEKA